MPFLRRIAVRVAACGLVGAAIAGSHDAALRARSSLGGDTDVLYLPAPRHLEQMSLRYVEALADLVWIKALIFTGEHLGQSNVTWQDRYIDAILELAPRFRRPYEWGGITAIYTGHGAVGRPMVERAAEIYRRGLAQFPEDPDLLYHYGMLLLHQVGSTPGYTPAEVKALAQEGAEALRRAAAFGADPVVRQYAATLVTDGSSSELAIAFLESQLLEAEDERYRRLLRHKLEALIGTERREAVDRTRRAFEAEHQARAPFMPPALYAVIRAEPGPFAPVPGYEASFAHPSPARASAP